MADKAKILLVDDREDQLVALEANLSSLDQTLVRAGSGEEALKALLTDDFAVILLDVQMPGMDGFETASHIKRRERTKDVPIIFLTAGGGERHQAFRGYASGAVDYITKPFDPWILRSKVQVFIDLFNKNRRLKEQADFLQRLVSDESTETPSGARIIDELSGRLAAVEKQVELLSEQTADAAPTTLVDSVSQLERQVGQLRAGFDLFKAER